ncbi:MAG TPA: DUF3107 domain-containing protein [Mycobacteriales bacterium]|nr:DUF3107 domain-containing protein [Mycobacteriales bacterium]
MEVKIGVQFAPRELVLESALPAREVEQAVASALSTDGGVLSLEDDKGRRVLIPAAKLAYVEIAADSAVRRVGFTS